jgi:Pyruvate/2-oxoacid:ferredoxin oxidoreductase delta subunit
MMRNWRHYHKQEQQGSYVNLRIQKYFKQVVNKSQINTIKKTGFWQTRRPIRPAAGISCMYCSGITNTSKYCTENPVLLNNFTSWSPKWTRWYRTKISVVTSCFTSLPTRDAINRTGRDSNRSPLKYRLWTTLFGTLVAVLQNVLDERSFLCEQENYFLKLMVQWWVPVNDDVMERFVLDVILCKHCDRPAKSDKGYK